MIEGIAKLIPDELQERSGSVFYSGRTAFASTSPLYILGLNPGGDPEVQARETVKRHTDKILNDVPDDWSAYRDESWGGGVAGTRGMQPRILHLMGKMGLDPGRVPAGNVVFLRSRRESGISHEFGTLADLCWPIHQAVLERARAQVVLCLGATAGNFVRQRLDAKVQVDEFVEANQRRWRSRSYRSPGGVTVVVATHPSIADWTAEATDPSRLVRNALAAA